MRIGKKGCAALLGGAVVASGLFALGTALARETDAVRAGRHDLDGRWVATSVRSISGELTGEEASHYGFEFDGGNVVARGLAGVTESRGTYQIVPRTRLAKIDLKLESGMALGVYTLVGDELTMTLNPMDMPERLGLLERGRPETLELNEHRLIYRFRRQPQ